MSEALYLEWRDVDLRGGRAIFWQTKSGRRLNADLPPRIVATLSAMKRLAPAVFTTHRGRPYKDRGRVGGGGQIKRAWAGALSRAGLDPELTPHDLRHTWATWHYALHKDLLLLKEAGGWSSVTLVERYAHLAPAGHETSIRRFLGTQLTRAPRTVAQVTARKRTFAPGYPLGKGEVVGSIPTGSTILTIGNKRKITLSAGLDRGQKKTQTPRNKPQTAGENPGKLSVSSCSVPTAAYCSAIE